MGTGYGRRWILGTRAVEGNGRGRAGTREEVDAHAHVHGVGDDEAVAGR